MTVNERMFYLLDEKHLKATDLSKALKVRNSTVSSWKQRGTSPPADYLLRICEFLEVSLYFLLTGEEEKKTAELTENETELLQNFKLLPEREQIKVLGIVEEKVKSLPAEISGKSLTSKIG